MSKQLAKSGDSRIETLRGMAIIAVVAHHTNLWLLGAINQANVEPGYISHLFNFFSEFFAPLRMPLFTVLSGWVYALKPANKRNIATFLKAKFRRILIPLFFVSTCFYFVILSTRTGLPSVSGKNGFPIPQQDFWQIWFYHFGHLWFLQLIISLYLIITIIDLCGLMKNVKQWLFWLAIAALITYIIPNGIELWSLSKLKKLTLFFLFGIGLNRFHEQIFNFNILKYLVFIILGAFLANYFLIKNFWPLLIVLGTVTPVYLLSLNFTFQPLIWIGKYSYSIYLYHGLTWYYLTYFSSDFLTNYQWAWALVFLSTGLFLPVIFEKFGEKIPVFRTPLLGRKPF